MESIEISQEKKVEPTDLLDNSWFFDNLFKTKRRPIIPRCYSDPSPSFSPNFIDHQLEISLDKSMEEAFSAIKKLPKEAGRFSRPAGLMRAPSLPEDSSSQRVRKSNLHRSSNSISRAPSLPASMAIAREEFQDDESDFSMSRLIRQASLYQSDLLPPRGSPKFQVATRSPSTPKQRSRTKPDIESVNTKISEGEVRRQHQTNRTRLGRSSSDMAFQELIGFRDLSIDKTKEPSSAKAWNEQSTSQTQVTEQWDDKRRSVEDDMKAQIKFWARTVASNVK